jgi:hypothetical protein
MANQNGPSESLTAAWVCTERVDNSPTCNQVSLVESVGGGCRDRTDDPLLAKQVLSQLS